MWRLADSIARLELDGLTAGLDLRFPARGLSQLVLQGHALDRAHLLCADIAESHGGEAQIADSYVRGDDLVVTYAETRETKLRLAVYWRYVPGESAATNDATAIEAQVSVQTSRLDIDPSAWVRSSLPAAQVKQLVGDELLDFSKAQKAASTSALPCYVLENPGEKWAYAEMVHPAEFDVPEVATGEGQTTLTHHLFSGTLEKGVILRCRIRGAFLAGGDGLEERAADAYRHFRAARLPLTT
jgi:hypothetical protein